MYATSLPPDSDLVRRARAADPHAVTTIYERYAQPIYRYVYARIGDEELARDIQSEVFVRMLEGLDRYEERGLPLAAWLYRIAHDRAVDTIRRRHRHRQVSIDECEQAIAGPEAELSNSEAMGTMRRSLGTLCSLQREVIRMRYLDERSIQEVATQLGRSEGAIRAIQHRGLRTLERIMRAADGEEQRPRPTKRRRKSE